MKWRIDENNGVEDLGNQDGACRQRGKAHVHLARGWKENHARQAILCLGSHAYSTVDGNRSQVRVLRYFEN